MDPRLSVGREIPTIALEDGCVMANDAGTGCARVPRRRATMHKATIPQQNVSLIRDELLALYSFALDFVEHSGID